MINKSTTKNVIYHHYILEKVDIINYFHSRFPSIDVPHDVKIIVKVPSGGDWSNMNLDIDSDSSIEILWGVNA